MKKKVGWRKRAKHAWWRFTDGIRYACGGGFWHTINCPNCERDVEIEVH